MWPLHVIRVSGLLAEDNRVLLIEQDVGNRREWFFPGGKLEEGETLGEAAVREFHEETGLTVTAGRLLYIADTHFRNPPLLHILFEVKRTGGDIRVPDAGRETKPIRSIVLAEIDELPGYGFSGRFIEQLRLGFPIGGAYLGPDPYFDLKNDHAYFKTFSNKSVP